MEYNFGKKIWDIPEKTFRNLVLKTKTWGELIRKCGYANSRNKKAILERIDHLNIDIKLLPLGSAWNKGQVGKYCKYTLDEILIENGKYSNLVTLRKRLIAERGGKHICSKCKLSKWLDEEIPLEIDHINGINNDHRIENLRFLCPNCHAQTDTYKSKNIRYQKKIKEKLDENSFNSDDEYALYDSVSMESYDEEIVQENIYQCIDCNIVISKYGKRCRNCAAKKFNRRKVIDRPSKEILLADVKEFGYRGTGRKYGVADNTIRKWLK
jgi:5-methylcytosine-specific restriction endonuclease McrA